MAIAYKKVVVEDSSGHIAQTSALSDKATILNTSRGISVSGDVATSKAVGFDGSADIALAVTLGSNTVGEGALKTKSGALSGGKQGEFLSSNGQSGFEWKAQTAPNDVTVTLTAGEGLSTGGSFTTNQGSASTVTFDLDSTVAGTGLSYSSGVISVDASQAITGVTGDFAIAGDLTVSGSTITTTKEVLEIADNTVVLNSDLGAGSNGVSAGIVVERGKSGDNAMLYWNEGDSAWNMGFASDNTLPSKGQRIATQTIQATLDATNADVPVGGTQVVGGDLYLRVS